MVHCTLHCFVGFHERRFKWLTYAVFILQSPPKLDSPLFELIEAEAKAEKVDPGLHDLQTNIF